MTGGKIIFCAFALNYKQYKRTAQYISMHRKYIVEIFYPRVYLSVCVFVVVVHSLATYLPRDRDFNQTSKFTLSRRRRASSHVLDKNVGISSKIGNKNNNNTTKKSK